MTTSAPATTITNRAPAGVPPCDTEQPHIEGGEELFGLVVLPPPLLPGLFGSVPLPPMPPPLPPSPPGPGPGSGGSGASVIAGMNVIARPFLSSPGAREPCGTTTNVLTSGWKPLAT